VRVLFIKSKYKDPHPDPLPREREKYRRNLK
jgi:hypothetical protein